VAGAGGSGGDGRSALLVAGTSPIATGEPVVWCTVVVTAPAVVRRDGRVQAQGRPCDHARLGAAEQELDRRCGPGTIDRIAAAVRPTGKIKAVARREMSVACTIRAVLLMTVMPDADSREVLTTLFGELTAVPWQRPHAVTVAHGAVHLADRDRRGAAATAAAGADPDSGSSGNPATSPDINQPLRHGVAGQTPNRNLRARWRRWVPHFVRHGRLPAPAAVTQHSAGTMSIRGPDGYPSTS
jgi:hypothetical protein